MRCCLFRHRMHFGAAEANPGDNGFRHHPAELADKPCNQDKHHPFENRPGADIIEKIRHRETPCRAIIMTTPFNQSFCLEMTALAFYTGKPFKMTRPIVSQGQQLNSTGAHDTKTNRPMQRVGLEEVIFHAQVGL